MSEEMASNVWTSRQLIAGDVIFHIKPVVYIIFHHLKHLYCNVCLKGSNSLKKCSKCSQRYYCDKNCQRIDWKYHKNECKVFSHENFKPEECYDEEILLIRLWLYFKSDPSFATKRYQLFDGSDVCLNEVEIDIEKMSKDIDISVEFYLICNHFKDLGLSFDTKELLHWYGIVRFSPVLHWLSNYNSVMKPLFLTQPMLGFGIYPQLSSVSHSCVPNSGVILNGISLQLRAIKSIAVGTQLTIGYVNLAQNKTDRHNDLKKHFLIDGCNCLKCEQSLDSNIDYEKFANFRLKMSKTFYLPNPQSVVNWNELQSMSKEMFVVSKQIFGDYHTERTAMIGSWIIISMSIKKIENRSLDMDLELYEELVRLFHVTHGDRHPIVVRFNYVLKSLLNK